MNKSTEKNKAQDKDQKVEEKIPQRKFSVSPIPIESHCGTQKLNSAPQIFLKS